MPSRVATQSAAMTVWVVEWGDTYNHSLAGRLRPARQTGP